MEAETDSILVKLRAGELRGVTRLDLCCGLTDFPPEIYELADTLEVLNLSGNALTSLPDDLPRLHKLRVIFCSDNQFTRVPEVLGACTQLEMVGFKANRIRELPAAALPPRLRWLILTDNELESLPAELGQCHRLQKLMLAGNRLQTLPESLAQCQALELVRLSANQFETLPAWLYRLPRLAWLAFAGNPLCSAAEVEAEKGATLASIPWSDLQLSTKLGEGASGEIHRASWQGQNEQTQVAVKLFKGELTSDGLPYNEKLACTQAGSHPHLVPLLGKVEGHPQGKRGMVMDLIDTAFRNLAGPPSLASCTRDVYAPAQRFSLAVVLRIATAVAATAAHLHARGILHGDLYAHNLLWRETGECLLGDFGAATLLSTTDDRAMLERIEVRAYACLLEELLQRCETEEGAVISALWVLQRSCDQADVAARPAFTEVLQRLARAESMTEGCDAPG